MSVVEGDSKLKGLEDQERKWDWKILTMFKAKDDVGRVTMAQGEEGC